MALSKPRETALKVLRDLDAEGAYLNIALENALGTAGMDRRDSALCTAIVIGTVKNRGYADHVISRLSTVKPDKMSVWILNILRMGIYCIKFMEKIPVSATVNECVKLAGRYGHRSSAGFVNAILRRAAEGGDFLDGLSGDKLLSVKYSAPLWLVEKWKREQPDCETLLAAMLEEPVTYARLNCGSVPENFEKADFTPYTLVYNGSGGVVRSEAYLQGKVAVQDPASQIAVMALDIKPGDRVLDLCAAPGGKSFFAAFLGGEVTACDIYENKIELIREGARRLGVKINAVLNDARAFAPEFENAFDRVIVDGPCSGLGILRRKPDIKWRKAEGDSGELARLQQEILTNAALYVRPGGRLVYSTCTVSKAENEGIARWFIKNRPDFVPAELGAGPKPGETMIQLRPDKHGTDGFYIASFRKVDGKTT